MDEARENKILDEQGKANHRLTVAAWKSRTSRRDKAIKKLQADLRELQIDSAKRVREHNDNYDKDIIALLKASVSGNHFNAMAEAYCSSQPLIFKVSMDNIEVLHPEDYYKSADEVASTAVPERYFSETRPMIPESEIVKQRLDLAEYHAATDGMGSVGIEFYKQGWTDGHSRGYGYLASQVDAELLANQKRIHRLEAADKEKLELIKKLESASQMAIVGAGQVMPPDSECEKLNADLLAFFDRNRCGIVDDKVIYNHGWIDGHARGDTYGRSGIEHEISAKQQKIDVLNKALDMSRNIGTEAREKQWKLNTLQLLENCKKKDEKIAELRTKVKLARSAADFPNSPFDSSPISWKDLAKAQERQLVEKGLEIAELKKVVAGMETARDTSTQTIQELHSHSNGIKAARDFAEARMREQTEEITSWKRLCEKMNVDMQAHNKQAIVDATLIGELQRSVTMDGVELGSIRDIWEIVKKNRDIYDSFPYSPLSERIENMFKRIDYLRKKLEAQATNEWGGIFRDNEDVIKFDKADLLYDRIHSLFVEIKSNRTRNTDWRDAWDVLYGVFKDNAAGWMFNSEEPLHERIRRLFDTIKEQQAELAAYAKEEVDGDNGKRIEWEKHFEGSPAYSVNKKSFDCGWDACCRSILTRNNWVGLFKANKAIMEFPQSVALQTRIQGLFDKIKDLRDGLDDQSLAIGNLEEIRAEHLKKIEELKEQQGDLDDNNCVHNASVPTGIPRKKEDAYNLFVGPWDVSNQEECAFDCGWNAALRMIWPEKFGDHVFRREGLGATSERVNQHETSHEVRDVLCDNFDLNIYSRNTTATKAVQALVDEVKELRAAIVADLPADEDEARQMADEKRNYRCKVGHHYTSDNLWNFCPKCSKDKVKELKDSNDQWASTCHQAFQVLRDNKDLVQFDQSVELHDRIAELCRITRHLRETPIPKPTENEQIFKIAFRYFKSEEVYPLASALPDYICSFVICVEMDGVEYDVQYAVSERDSVLAERNTKALQGFVELAPVVVLRKNRLLGIPDDMRKVPVADFPDAPDGEVK